ncbi:MAG: hypothetical protein ACRDH9_10165 [Actinomycetota bacterium]
MSLDPDAPQGSHIEFTSQRRSVRRDVRVGLTLLGMVLLLLAALFALGDLYRRNLEDFAWAESRCTGLVPEGSADSQSRHRCIDRELSKGPLEIVWPELLVVGASLILILAAGRIRPASE